MRKIFTLIAAVAAIFSADAQNVWNLQGKGSEAEPWLVSSAADFQSIAENISAENTGKGEYFLMTQDIDFGGTADSPVQLPAIGKAAITNINNVAYGFEGVFDGNGKSVSGIFHTNKGNDDAGKFNALFSSVGKDGVIKNLVFAKENHVSSYNYAAPIASVCSGRIENCVNHSDITAANAFAAGICGYLVNGCGAIVGCTNNGSITATTYACGIVSGSQSGAKITAYQYSVSGCKNCGEITATAGTGAAGIAGSYSGAVYDCTNEGRISSKKMSGGIVSCLTKGDDAEIAITGCTNRGEIMAGDGASNIGGIVGTSQRSSGKVTLVRCTNEGAISGSGTTLGNLRGNENIAIGEGCVIAAGLAKLPLDPDDTNGIATLSPTPLKGEGVRYNLQGVRVGENYNGIVIVNGKKVIRK